MHRFNFFYCLQPFPSQKKSQGKSVEFVLTHQYKSLENIPTLLAKNNSIIVPKTAIAKSTVYNHNCSSSLEKRESCLKGSTKNATSSLRKKSKEPHLLTCVKSASVALANSHNCGKSSASRRESKCEQCGHIKCFNSVNSRDHVLSKTNESTNLCRNNSNVSDRGSRFRSHSASSTSYVTRSLDNNETRSITSLDSNDVGCNGDELSIRDRIAYAQIFLEAIGNASTQKNINSSRFVSGLLRASFLFNVCFAQFSICLKICSTH